MRRLLRDERASPAPSVSLAVLLCVNAVVALGGWHMFGLPAWGIGLGIILSAAVVDLGMSPRPRSVAVRRTVDEVLSIGEGHTVELDVENHSKSPLTVTLKDEPPLEFDRSEGLVTVHVPPQGHSVGRYTVTPSARGQFSFAGVTYRYPTRWRLWLWQGRLNLSAAVRVYPNLVPLRRQRLVAEQKYQREQGERRPSWLGQGTDFDRLREYVPDDEPRHLNWLATARRGRLMVNEYQSPRNQTVMLLFDAGRLGAAQVGSGAIGSTTRSAPVCC